MVFAGSWVSGSVEQATEECLQVGASTRDGGDSEADQRAVPSSPSARTDEAPASAFSVKPLAMSARRSREVGAVAKRSSLDARARDTTSPPDSTTLTARYAAFCTYGLAGPLEEPACGTGTHVRRFDSTKRIQGRKGGRACRDRQRPGQLLGALGLGRAEGGPPLACLDESGRARHRESVSASGQMHQ